MSFPLTQAASQWAARNFNRKARRGRKAPKPLKLIVHNGRVSRVVGYLTPKEEDASEG